MVQRKIRAEFPSVRHIRTGELAAWLRDPHRKPPLLLDVRTAEEFNVSHISGAQRVEPVSPDAPDEDIARLKQGIAKNAPIVTYCSVGYRSSAFAKKLREAGFTNAQNLEGSIFQWANENRPLVDAHGKPTDKAHPYNALWGRMLNKTHRASIH